MKTEKELEELRAKMLEIKNALLELEPEEVEKLMEDLPVEEKELEAINAAGYVVVPVILIAVANTAVSTNAAVNFNAAVNANGVMNANAVTHANANIAANVNATFNVNASVNK